MNTQKHAPTAFISLILFLVLILPNNVVFASEETVNPPAVKDEYIVVMKESANIEKEAAKLERKTSIEEAEILDENTTAIKIEETANSKQVLQELSNNPNVECVEPNYLITVNNSIETEGVPTSDKYEQYELDMMGIRGLWNAVLLRGTSYKPKVAVIDTGCSLTHEDLTTINKDLSVDVTATNPDGTYKKLTKLTTPYSGNHGTSVMGLLSAYAGNNKGTQGVASAKTNNWIDPIAIKVSESGDTFSIKYVMLALDYAKEHNVDIINMSFCATAPLESLHAKVKQLADAGIIMVASGGNSIDEGEVQNTPAYPSDWEECISITSINKEYASTSLNKGWRCSENKDFCAPGENLIVCSTPSKYAKGSGTSFSAPLVTGTIALLKVLKPTITKDEVYNLLKQTATDIPGNFNNIPDGKDVYTGYGLVQSGLAACQLITNGTHQWKTIDGTRQCQFCGETNSWVDVEHTHSFTKRIISDNYLKSVKACNKPLTYYYACDLCNISSKGINNSKTFTYILEHDWKNLSSVAATCYTPGKTDYKKCLNCNQTTFTEVPKLEHNYSTCVINKPASPNQNGELIYFCKYCDHEKSVPIARPKEIVLYKSKWEETGKPIKNALYYVKDANNKVIDSKLYTVEYKNNTKCGTASIKISFKSVYYSGSLTKTFQIVPKGLKLNKIITKNKYSLLKWYKYSGSGTRGQIQYSTKKNMKNAKTIRNLKIKSKSSVKLPKLKQGKKYWFRTRSYVTKSGKKYYSDWEYFYVKI